MVAPRSKSADASASRAGSRSRGAKSDVGKGALIGGRYRVLATIGRGGMGEVYRAFDEREEVDVALKRFNLRATRVDDQQRFRREFHTLARLRHPRIVEAYDFGVDGDRPYYAMELIDGRELAEIAPVPWSEACVLLRDVASALAFLHTHGLLHRDVSPRNVRCDRNGRAKLLDFGMLTTMGVSNEVVGTLPSIAPEMLLGLPIDGRADLYGLGALGYWLTTGRHPGRVRSLDELLRHGRRPPTPPSTLEADLPAELDELLLSMLSSEPMARPTSAAVVIERLESIASLEPMPDVETARGYVHSAALVGRKREMSIARARLQRTAAGHGGALIIEGNSGMGKTRLLREVELEAKLIGATVVRGRVDGDGPYALIRQLAEGLIQTLPDAMDRPGSTKVGQLLSPLELAESTGWSLLGGQGESEPADPREERLELQAELSNWLTTFGADRPVVLIVDDIQRSDEASAACLAGLAYASDEAAVLVVGALRTDEPTRARRAVSKLRDYAVVLRVRGLSDAEVETLCSTVFGEPEGLPRLAASIHRATGGSPMLCIELIRHLVEGGIVRYEGGMWVIPDRVDEDALPGELAAALDTRIAGLKPRSIGLAQALAVHGGNLPLASCVKLADVDEFAAFSALDELVDKGIVAGSESGFHIAHDGLLEAILRAMNEDKRATLELKVAELLLREGADTPAIEARIGRHLVRGGNTERGVRFVTRSARRLFDATSFDDAAGQLEVALKIHRERGSSPRLISELYTMLITAGFYANREVAARHKDDALDLLGTLGGVPYAKTAQKFLGMWLGLMVGVAIAYVIYYVGGRGRRPKPRDALQDYAKCLAYSAGVAGFSFNSEAICAAAERAHPLSGSRRPEVHLVVSFIDNLYSFNQGEFGPMIRRTEESIALFSKVDASAITAAERATGIGGARFQRGLALVRSGSPDAMREVEALEALGHRLWELGAMQLRTYYHLWRGEDSAARKLRTATEVEFLRLGSLWQLDAIHDPTSAQISAYIGDVLQLRRAIEAIERLIDHGMHYRQHLALARADYSRLRKQFDECAQHLEDASAHMPEGDGGIGKPWALCIQADLLLERGDAEEAIAQAKTAMDYAAEDRWAQPPFRVRAARTLAMATAAAGDPIRSAEMLDELIAEGARLRNPFVEGWLHEARALVALDAGQQHAAEEHAVAMEARLTPTQNPVLIARCERLRRQVRPEELEPPDESARNELVTEVVAEPAIEAETLADMMTVLSGCDTAGARAQRALELVLAASGSPRGYLFLAHDGVTHRVAPPLGNEPPDSVTKMVAKAVDDAQSGRDRPSTRFIAEEDHTAWVCRMLPFTDEHREVPIGAVAMLQPEGFLPKPPASLLAAIAERLFAAGDASLPTS